MRARTAPEILQTSWLDCGPAALTSVLGGFGAAAPYERVRAMCSTGIDGTSIDSIEEVAISAGLDAVQMVVPVEQMLAMPEDYFPSIVAITLPDGFAHFVVAWRAGGRRVALMDPATGRRTESHEKFGRELYTHHLAVSAEMWRDWAASPIFTEGLVRRCRRLGIASAHAKELVAAALADTSPHGLAALDAALRFESARAPRFRWLRRRLIRDRLRQHIVTRGAELPPDAWSCVIPGAPSADVTLKGAVLLVARSWSRESADPETRAQLESAEPSPLETLRQAVSRVRWLPVALVLTGAMVATAQVVQTSLFRSFLGSGNPAVGWLIVVVVCLIGGRFLSAAGALRMGREIDGHVRAAWLAAPPRLPASFIQSRPLSDIVFRAHSTHRLRDFPTHAVQLVTAALIATVASFAIVISAPQTAVAVGLLFVVSVGVPWVFSRKLAQADLRALTLSGCLARPVADALLGSQAIRQKGVQSALLGEHDRLARSWERALRHLALLTGASRAVSGIAAGAGLAWCLSLVHKMGIAPTLLVLVLGVLIIDTGSVCAQILQTLPRVRSTLLRQSGPLNAYRVAPARVPQLDTSADAFSLHGVTVLAGSVPLVRDITIAVPEKCHVAVVGPSGSGKSTLLSVLLGTVEVTSGLVQRAPTIESLDATWASPTARLWSGTVRANAQFACSRAAAPVEVRLAQVGVSDPGRFADRDVGEGGALLSDGEAQRVRLARALGRPDAPLVVLDEAMRGLPRQERASLLADVRGVWAGSTVVCALHEVPDAMTFDLVIVMEHGQVVEYGEPRRLLTLPGSRFQALLDDATTPLDGWRRVDLSSSVGSLEFSDARAPEQASETERVA